MKDSELQFDRTCHVLYSKPCKKEILAKIALHYPEAEREAVWEKVQRQYVAFLSDWRTDLGGKKNFHNGAGGTYDCIAILSISKTLFMLALVKYSAFRVGCRFRNFLFLGRFRFVKRLLAVVVSLFVNFFHQLLFVDLCRLRYRLFDRFL